MIALINSIDMICFFETMYNTILKYFLAANFKNESFFGSVFKYFDMINITG